MGLRKILLVMALLGGPALAAPIATASGPVEGFGRNGVTQFLGVPYAAPPVGALRWMPPQPAAKWSAVRKTIAFGPTCAQVTTLGPFAGPANSNEDCLYLNVFTPDVKAKLPVLVWIHGGGYVDGESNDYDGSKLARDGKMVVVAINYRLNLFGFVTVPALGGSGNYGIEDMQAALRWVHANIAAFGGDAGNVTVGGQSAGGGAAAALVVSPGARGLIHRAIFQSGGYTPFAGRETALDHGRKFVAAAGCDTAKDVAACLRALPASKIIALAGTASTVGPLTMGPNVDGAVIPQQTIDAIDSGNFNKVPVMVGTTHDEGNFDIGITQYFKPDRTPATLDDYKAFPGKKYGGGAGPGGAAPNYAATVPAVVLAHYPVTDGVQPAWTAAASDPLACRGQYLSKALSKHVPVYTYLFDDRTAPSYFPSMPGYQARAYHTGDIQYVFAGYHGGPDGAATHLDSKQQQLSGRMIAAWSNFARTGNPNGAGDAPWPRWQADGAAAFIQDDSWSHVQTHAEFAAQHQCGLWQSILLYR